jgi:hypothetical protein
MTNTSWTGRRWTRWVDRGVCVLVLCVWLRGGGGVEGGHVGLRAGLPLSHPQTRGPTQVLAGRHIDLLKIDVEGFEPDVVDGAARLISQRKIDNIIMEYSPHVAEKATRCVLGYILVCA